MRLAQFTYQNEFGDWVNYTNYCFRKDGTLFQLHAQLNSFHGDMTMIRDLSFNTQGGEIARHQYNYALGTRNPRSLIRLLGTPPTSLSPRTRSPVCQGLTAREEIPPFKQPLGWRTERLCSSICAVLDLNS